MNLLLEVSVLGTEAILQKLQFGKGLVQLPVGSLALKFGPGTSGKYLQDRDRLCGFAHKLIINHREMTDDFARRVKRRGTEVALCLHVHEVLVTRKKGLNILRVVANFPFENSMTRRGTGFIFKTRSESVPVPER